MNFIEEIGVEIKELMPRGRKWIRVDSLHLSVYVRVTQRYINDIRSDSIDIANVEVDEDEQGKGNFTVFLSAIEFIARKLERKVFIESIMNERLQKYLTETLGYKVTTEQHPECMCLVKDA